MPPVTARKEKLLAMCEAQCASLRSRLERRVNRVPSNKRNIKLIDILEPTPPQKAVSKPAPKPAPAKKEKEVPLAPLPPLKNRRTRPAQATAATPVSPVTKPAVRPAPKPAPRPAPTKATRGVKRTSDEMSEDKENSTELSIPMKRAKAAPATTRTTRTTRAASKKVDPAPQVLSPKTNNARPATRTRRQR
jgi:hypothetical protein